MNLPLLISILATFSFGIISIILSLKEEKTRKLLKETEETQKQKIYEISILKEIQDRIGYSLDVEQVVDVITGSLRHLFPYSSASSIVIKNEKLIFKAYIEESVSQNFVDQVKKSMLASLSALLPNLKENIEYRISGVPLDNTNSLAMNSFFHIPIVVRGNVVGLINISSVKPNLYKENEMTILYQIAGQASNALSRLEEILETEKGKLTSMVGGLADGVFMIDTKKELMFINESAKKFLGINPPAGGEPNFFDVLNELPNDYDFIANIDKSISQNLTIAEKEIKIKDKIFQIFLTPVLSPKDNEKRVIGASILLHDITIEKSLDRLKEDFTNSMVHELRAPLTSIKDASELLISDIDKFKNEDDKKLLDIIENQSKFLLSQVGQVLDAAKIEAKSLVVNKNPEDLGKLINESVKNFAPQAMKKNIILSADIEPDLPIIYFDSIRITQVMNNLLSNALKFTPFDGRIKVTATRDTGLVTVSVSDTGIGIPKDKQENIFSKFYQVPEAQKNLIGTGTGLGLYTVKGIVEAHKGYVNLISEEGKGTTISFTLPFEKNLSPQPTPEHLYSNLN